MKEPISGDCFTLNPYYIRNNDARITLRCSIESMYPNLNFISFEDCKHYEWNTIYQSSYFEPQYQGSILSLKYNEIVLVEDGLFDYVNSVKPYTYYEGKNVYIFKPEFASNQALCAERVEKLEVNNDVLALFNKQYEGILTQIAEQSKGVPILYTTPLQEDFDVSESFVPTMLSFISKLFATNKLILKRHPRDHFHYELNGLEIIECPQQVPGQFLDKACDGINLFIFPSTVSFMCSDMSEILFLNVLPNNIKYTKSFDILNESKLFDKLKGIKVMQMV